MTFEVELNGRSRAVSVERTGPGRYRVIVDGVPHEVDAARVGEFGLSVVGLDSGACAHGVSREIQIAPSSARGPLLVTIDGRLAVATVDGRRTGRGGADSGAHTHGAQTIVAPMPGRVVRVLVAAGDAVAAKQPVIVVEAMKMENELRSPKAGRVKEVAVAAGTSVEVGRRLMVIE